MHRHHQLRPLRQLGLPGTQGPLKLLRHGAQQHRQALRHALRSRQRHHGRHRVVLVRHAGRATSTGLHRFGHLRNFKLAHQCNVFGQLAQAAGEQGQLTGQRHPLVALGVPAGHRQAQGQLTRHQGGHRIALVLHFFQRAHRATQLQLQGIHSGPLGARQAAHQGRRPAGTGQPKAGDTGGLHEGARQQRRLGMLLGQGQQRSHCFVHVGADQRQRIAGHQHHGGVNRVLAGAAKVDETGGLRVKEGDRFFEDFDQRQRHAAGPCALAHDLGHIKQLNLAGAHDRCGGGLGNQPGRRLGPGQRGFKLKHRGQKTALTEHLDRLGRGQKTVKQGAHPVDNLRPGRAGVSTTGFA